MKRAGLSKTKRPIKVYFDLEPDENGYPPARTEFLWCIPTQRGTYTVDNIPFFVRDISLEDEISAHQVGRLFQFSGIVRKSRNSTVRVLMKKPEKTGVVRETLDRFGCGTELMDELSLITVSMPPNSNIAEALAFLDNEAEKGHVGIEESAVRYQ
jgi:hypothetical protein